MPREKDSRLTEDQLIAAELLVYGATNKEVADQLDVCEKTIMRWKKRPESRKTSYRRQKTPTAAQKRSMSAWKNLWKN